MTSRTSRKEPSFDAVIFDIGGVLINDARLRENAIKQLGVTEYLPFWTALNECFLPASRGEEALAVSWKRLAERLGLVISEEVAASLWIDDYNEGILVDEEVLAIINTLKKQVKAAVISNTIDEHARVLRTRGVYAPFDEVLLSHEVRMTKDTPGIFKLALQRLGFPAERCVFIDDVERYCKVAKDIGMTAILFTDAESLRKDLLDLGFRL